MTFTYGMPALMLLTDNGNQLSIAGREYSEIMTVDANLTATIHETVLMYFAIAKDAKTIRFTL